MAPGFGSDYVELIEQNRRRSTATSRILRLRHGEIWPEDGMLKRDIGVFRVPKGGSHESNRQKMELDGGAYGGVCFKLRNGLRPVGVRPVSAVIFP